MALLDRISVASGRRFLIEEDETDDFTRCLSFERNMPGHHLVDNRTQTP